MFITRPGTWIRGSKSTALPRTQTQGHCSRLQEITRRYDRRRRRRPRAAYPKNRQLTVQTSVKKILGLPDRKLWSARPLVQSWTAVPWVGAPSGNVLSASARVYGTKLRTPKEAPAAPRGKTKRAAQRDSSTSLGPNTVGENQKSSSTKQLDQSWSQGKGRIAKEQLKSHQLQEVRGNVHSETKYHTAVPK